MSLLTLPVCTYTLSILPIIIFIRIVLNFQSENSNIPTTCGLDAYSFSSNYAFCLLACCIILD
jgi:hypothetical protein